ncbi:cell division protein FtsQ/DivIB, partial [Xanthomonas perforans]|uniref:cell division protein FtsQ/DivIB n=1 Tax=Xanthomonas perforans TaxID=442694 RepID=UPI001F3B2FEF
RRSWSLGLSNGVQIVVGRDDARARLQRFARVLPQLSDPQRPIARADLRYTNGFTVERQRLESGDSGLEKAQPRHRAAPSAPPVAQAVPRFPNPVSRISNPGFKT